MDNNGSCDDVILLPWVSNATDSKDDTTDMEPIDNVILLPWKSGRTNCDQKFGFGDKENLLRPCYPDSSDYIHVFDSRCKEVEIPCLDNVITLPWYSTEPNRCQDFASGYERGKPTSPLPDRISQFTRMGFPEEIVKKALAENEETEVEDVLETLLTHTPRTPTSSLPDRISQFTGMGFPEEIVKKAISENEETEVEDVLETLLTRSARNKSPSEYEPFSGDSSNSDCWLHKEKDDEYVLEKDNKLSLLLEMGFTMEDASSAIDSSGPEISVLELVDFIYASQAAKIDDDSQEGPSQPPMIEDDQPPMIDDDPLEELFETAFNETETGVSDFQCYTSPVKKRKTLVGADERWQRRVSSYARPTTVRKGKQKKLREDSPTSYIPRTMMIGFGVPSEPRPWIQRTLPEAAIGPPYFYYENVAYTPSGVWSTISRFLYEIEPEYVDSVYFCASARKRGYIHNLPIHGRFPLLPIPPQTIQEALPRTRKWWPSWDKRTKFNCLHTRVAWATITQNIRDALERCDGEPPVQTQNYILGECRRWHLIWTGKNKVAPLEPDEIELVLGYPKDHTRGGGATRTDRYNALGNSFQVDTVAYHLSVLKSMFPDGINVLSLFSGIGGAEVALHRLGIPMKNVVSVEISEVNRNIIRSWWEETSQKGRLIELEDVQQLSPEKLESLMDSLGGFDLVVGGSPCNNLAGNNRVTRSGLQGVHSVLFYDYFRILNIVKMKMGNRK